MLAVVVAVAVVVIVVVIGFVVAALKTLLCSVFKDTSRAYVFH